MRVEPKVGECWFIFRRYTDFVRLLTQLRRQKAAISHLSLPRKKWLGDNFAPSFLDDRIRGLQDFVNGILKSNILVQIPCVREFFCLDEPPALSDTVEESRVRRFHVVNSALRLSFTDNFVLGDLRSSRRHDIPSQTTIEGERRCFGYGICQE